MSRENGLIIAGALAALGAAYYVNYGATAGGLETAAAAALAAVKGGKLKLSEQGKAAIKAREGLRLKKYRDAKGYSVGYGHFILPMESLDVITVAKAEELFAADVVKHENAVNAYASATLKQNEFDALVSFSYNAGVSALRTSTLLKLFNAGNKAGAGGEFAKWVHEHKPDGSLVVNAQLVIRRAGERAQFLA